MKTPDIPPSSRSAEPATLGYVARVLIAVAIVGLGWVLLQLRDVFMIGFASIVAAVALRTASGPLEHLTGLGPRVALAVVVLVLVVAAALGLWLIGAPLGEQFDALRVALPQALDAAMRWLRSHDLGLLLLDWWDGAKDNLAWGRIAGLAGSAVGALAAFVLVVVAGVYLAADPSTYRDGALRLLPPAHRLRAREALELAGYRLSRWLLAQGVAMLAVGVMTGVGLALLGLPLPVPLGVIAGLLEFIPFFGTFLAGGLIVLLAFAQGLGPALHAALLCIAVQQFEGYVLQPFVQRWAVALPPVLGLVSVVVFGVLVGPLGVVFATPLMVVVLVLVKHLYVDAVLEPHDQPL